MLITELSLVDINVFFAREKELLDAAMKLIACWFFLCFSSPELVFVASSHFTQEKVEHFFNLISDILT